MIIIPVALGGGCGQYRCNGVLGTKTREFRCQDRTEEDIKSDVGVLLNEQNKTRYSYCKACRHFDGSLVAQQQKSDRKNNPLSNETWTTEQARDVLTAIETNPSYSSKSGKTVNWKALVGEVEGVSPVQSVEGEKNNTIEGVHC